ncbi:MAG: NAD-dependent succinate-semialdehyde dehydrogenase [Gammaproteobacteria bacterium]|nr:NAD-dependent succinate-semialdehyde dehydrogenase [Gammaproteobacteria bacterium]
MGYTSTNPANGEITQRFDSWDEDQLENALACAHSASKAWKATSFDERATLLFKLATQLRDDKERLARIVTEEMGKLIIESRAEVEKCADVCDYYAEHGADFLADEMIRSDASRSFVAYQPLGVVLAVMPWNFPLWQVMRFAAPAIMAGNVGLLKHASNVPQCALALEQLFDDAGFPVNVFQTLLIDVAQVADVIADKRVHAVTLTGSTSAGQKIASCAGHNIKKSVLELGGSDPFIVLDDADIDLAVENAVKSRYLNAGQSCIAAKRFIVTPGAADEFVKKFKVAVEPLTPGDPTLATTTLAPMARIDLRDEIHEQVTDSIAAGAKGIIGCHTIAGEGTFYPASILDYVTPACRAYKEELFGPVAIVIRAKDEDDAINIANESEFGLGGSVWSQNSAHGEQLARRVDSGAVFVNGRVKSDPRLPFGGIKLSGYGRELAEHGIREFVNAKTIWVR